MKRRGLQLSRRHRWSLYGIGITLLLSGLAWAWLHHLDEAGHANDAARELKPWLMKAHGFAALGFVLLLGTLLPVHVRHSWHARRNRANGVFFLSSVSLLTLTGYLLYYLGNEKLRALCSDVHFWLGAIIPLLLIWHIWSGRRATRANSAREHGSRPGAAA
jgi:cation transport ATPase